MSNRSGMLVGGARLVTCVTFVLTGPLSLSNALRQRCYPQECIRTAKTIDERTVVRRTNTNNMQDDRFCTGSCPVPDL